MLAAFMSDSPENHCAYENVLYDSLLQSAMEETDLAAAAAALSRAETMLLQDAVFIPLYCETGAFVTRPGIEGLPPAAYPTRIQFKYAAKTQ